MTEKDRFAAFLIGDGVYDQIRGRSAGVIVRAFNLVPSNGYVLGFLRLALEVIGNQDHQKTNHRDRHKERSCNNEHGY